MALDRDALRDMLNENSSAESAKIKRKNNRRAMNPTAETLFMLRKE